MSSPRTGTVELDARSASDAWAAAAPCASDPDPAPLPSLRHSILGLAADEGIESWRQQLIGYSDNLPATPGTAFEADTTSWHLGGLLLIDAHLLGARRQERDSRKVRISQVDHYRLLLQLSGDLRLDLGDQRLIVPPGRMVMTDLSRTQRYEADRGANIVLIVPRDLLHEAMGVSADLHGAMPDGVGARLLSAYLINLARQAPAMRAFEAPDVSTATVRMIAAAFAQDARTRQAAAPAINRTLLRQIQQHIDAHLDDPTLDVDHLCRGFRISRATLYRLFESSGGIAQHVRQRRLERIHDQLLAAQTRVHMAQLADRYGFGSAAHFSQAFRKHFGYSPSEARERAGAGVGARRVVVTSASLSDWLMRLGGPPR